MRLQNIDFEYLLGTIMFIACLLFMFVYWLYSMAKIDDNEKNKPIDGLLDYEVKTTKGRKGGRKR